MSTSLTVRFASIKLWKPIAGDFKEIYQAPTVAAAEAGFEEFAERSQPVYSAMVEMWRRRLDELMPFLNFPVEIRKLIYPTSGIESLNARFRSTTERRGDFPDVQSAMKVLYRAVLQRRHNRPNSTGKVDGWKAILTTLELTHGDRLGMN